MTNALRLVERRPNSVPPAIELDSSIIDAIYGGCLEWENWRYALDLLKLVLNLDIGFIMLGASRAGETGKAVATSGADAARVQRALAAIQCDGAADGLVQSKPVKILDEEASALFFDLKAPEKGATMRTCFLRDEFGWPFSKAERSVVQLYVPVFRKAFEIYVAIASQRYALEDYRQTAVQLSVCILTITDEMGVLHQSGALNAIFGRECEFGINPQNRLYMKDKVQNDELMRHVEQAAQSIPRSIDWSRHVLMLPSAAANGWWSILCKRMHEDVFAGGELGPCVKLYIRFVPSLPQITPDLMLAAMGLTPRQAEVAAGIVNGMDMDAIAAVMGISRNTVRVHVAAIYARTLVRSRSEFTFLALRRLNNGWC